MKKAMITKKKEKCIFIKKKKHTEQQKSKEKIQKFQKKAMKGLHDFGLVMCSNIQH